MRCIFLIIDMKCPSRVFGPFQSMEAAFMSINADTGKRVRAAGSRTPDWKVKAMWRKTVTEKRCGGAKVVTYWDELRIVRVDLWRTKGFRSHRRVPLVPAKKKRKKKVK